MGYRNQEKEIKMQVLDNMTYDEVVARLKTHLREQLIPVDPIVGRSSDLYWPLNKAHTMEFVRLRQYDTEAFITTKNRGAKSILRRKEIDVRTTEPSQAKALLCCLFGDSPVSVNKKYHVFQFNEVPGANLSVYKVTGSPQVFLEAEANTLTEVRQLVKLASNCGLSLAWVNSSIFEMFVKNQPPDIRPLEDAA